MRPLAKLATLWVAPIALTWVAASNALAIQITQVRIDKSHFYPAKGEVVDVRFVLSERALPSLQIYDGRDWLVKKIDGTETEAGEHSLVWDGQSSRGRLVPAEAYHYTISAITADGHEVVHDLTDVAAGEEMSASDVLWDSTSHIIQYRLPAMGRVNVRVGIKNFGPLMKTVIDWVPRPGGLNKEFWDGMDQSAELDLSEHPNLQIVVDSFALGANTILVGELSDQVQLVPDLDATDLRTPTARRPQPKHMHFHSQQPIEQRGDIDIGLLVNDGTNPEVGGVPIVSGQVPIRMEVSSQDTSRVLETRFEPVFYVDGIFVFENEVGFVPFTWIWDTTRETNGIHYVTANLRGYEGNFGIATIRVRINNSSVGADP